MSQLRCIKHDLVFDASVELAHPGHPKLEKDFHGGGHPECPRCEAEYRAKYEGTGSAPISAPGTGTAPASAGSTASKFPWLK
jgi:hypothetical protein